MTWREILIFIGIVLAVVIVLKLFKVGLKGILRFVINAVIGGLLLYFLNYIPGLDLPINWWTTLLTGIFGIPAVIIIIIITLFF